MVKFWRVVAYEYTRHVLRRRFLFALLSVPALMGVMVLVGFLIVQLENEDTPIGYVDQSGLLANPVSDPRPPDQAVRMEAYPDEAEARAALEAGEIQGYFLLPQDYIETGDARLVYIEAPSDAAQEQFEDFVRANLLASQPAAVTERFTRGSELTVISMEGNRRMSESNWFSVFVPFVAGLAFIIAIFTSSGYLMQAVVEEKENRTMEIVVTSVSPAQMMSGKIIGIIAVGLTQILVWLVVAVAGVLIGRNYFEWMEGLRLPPGSLGIMLLVMIPGFILIAALMAMLGATVTEEREGQQVTGLFTLPVVAPYWFTAQIMGNPNGPLAQGLSLFPLTAPVTLTMRSAFTTLPAEQVALSTAILALSALSALWLAGRAFRLGMLRYGQRVAWREIFRGLA